MKKLLVFLTLSGCGSLDHLATSIDNATKSSTSTNTNTGTSTSTSTVTRNPDDTLTVISQTTTSTLTETIVTPPSKPTVTTLAPVAAAAPTLLGSSWRSDCADGLAYVMSFTSRLETRTTLVYTGDCFTVITSYTQTLGDYSASDFVFVDANTIEGDGITFRRTK